MANLATINNNLLADSGIDPISVVTGSGIAGQVSYWNGTNSQTGSNNLFWDAANSRLGVGRTADTDKFEVQGNIRLLSGVVALKLQSTGTQDQFQIQYDGVWGRFIGVSTTFAAINKTSGNLILQNGGTFTDAGYRLDVNGTARVSGNATFSGNVGIGTTSPGASLHVAGAISSTPTGSGVLMGLQGNFAVTHLNGSDGGLIDFSVSGTDTRGRILYTNSTNAMTFGTTDGTTDMTLDTSGNLGLGVTPSAWTNCKAIDISTIGSVFADGFSQNNQAGFATNAYRAGAAVWYYKITAAATYYAQDLGTHKWFSAASGTAGNAITFTQAMTLTSGGNLLVGTTTDSGQRLAVNGSVKFDADAATNGFYWDNTNKRLGIGENSPQAKLYVRDATSGYAAIISNTSAGGDYLQMLGDSGNRVFEFGSGGTGGDGFMNVYSDNVQKVLVNADGASYFNGGNVGIGNISAIAKLHVTGNLLSYSEAANTAALFIAANNSYNWQFGINNGSDYVITENGGVNAIGTTRFSVKPGGNVLIGTTTDTGYRVQITGTGDNMLNVWGATAPSIRLDNAASAATQRFVIGLATGTNQFIQGAVAGNVCITTATSSPMVFGMWQTSTSEEVMRITTSKNLLINKTADGGQKLQVSGAINFASLPTSSAGLSSGDIWNNGGVLNIV